MGHHLDSWTNPTHPHELLNALVRGAISENSTDRKALDGNRSQMDGLRADVTPMTQQWYWCNIVGATGRWHSVIEVHDANCQGGEPLAG